MCCERKTLTANLVRTSRREELEGRVHVVVPVVMARATVEMNGALIEDAELFAEAWNGVPVTVGHPEVNGGFLTANSPDALERWAVGRIFSAKNDNGDLKGEAWIDVEKAEKVRPGLVAMLESDEPMDVSTGYYSDVEQRNGKTYHQDIKPDHLALLPDEQGACDWASGCGVRNRRHTMQELIEKISGFLTTNKAPVEITDAFEKVKNERGDDDDFRQMIADLISNDESPFLPEDEDSLRMMSVKTLTKMRDSYVPKTNAKQEVNMTDETNTAEPTPVLTDEDKAALAFSKNQYAAHRNSLVAKIAANSELTEEQLEDWDVPKLEQVANGLKPAPDYSGRGEPGAVLNADSTEAAGMAPQGVINALGGEK